MKKLKIVLCLLLAVLTVLCLCACDIHTCKHVCPTCGGCLDLQCDNSVCAEKCTCVKAVTDDMGIHYQLNTLHKRNVTPSQIPFVEQSKTEYVILTDTSDTYKAKAATLIKTHVGGATSADIAILEMSELPQRIANWTPQDKLIVIGCDELFAKANLSMPQDDLGHDGYYIKSVGNTVFIATQDRDGYQMGAICFLQETVGYDMLAGDLSVYDKDGATMPIFDVIERPDYAYRAVPEVVGNVGRYGMGYTDNGILMAYNGNVWHNSFTFVPPETYNNPDDVAKYHPKWYSKEVIPKVTTSKDAFTGQLCYTAHGDAEEYEALVQLVVEGCKETINANPQLNCLNIGEQDCYDWCDCPACMATIEHYGSESSTCLLFVNEVARRVKAYYEDPQVIAEHGKRDIIITFFAYHRTEKSPTQLNEDGSYSPMNGIHCEDNVGIVFAPIKAKYNNSFYEEANKLYADNMISWGCVCDNLFVWYYETNFSHYLVPYNTWDTVAESYRFALSCNAVYMYNEGQWNQPISNGFSKLKEYLDAKLLVNVNLNYNDLVDKFFDGFYGDAGEIMRKYFDELQTHYEVINQEYGAIAGGISDDVEKAEYWPRSLLVKWDNYCKQAMEAIEGVKLIDAEKYKVYYNHILLESIFPRYMLYTVYAGYFDANELKENRAQFKADCAELGMTLIKENTASTLDGLFDSWGV